MWRDYRGKVLEKAEKDIISAHIFKGERKLTWVILKDKLTHIKNYKTWSKN